jgi:AraC-like DNA-binding protein
MSKNTGTLFMKPSPGSYIRLSTNQFAERDRIEAAREAFGRAIMSIDFEPALGAPFHMDMMLRALPDFGLAAGTRSAMTCIRSRQVIDSDDLIVAFVRSGSGVFQFHGRETHINAGGATVLRSAGEGRLSLPSIADMISYRFPFNRMAPLIADLDAVLVRPIPANSAALRLLVNYANVLQDKDTLATPQVRSVVATHLHDLAALAIGATGEAAEVASGRGVRAARLRAIKTAVVENLANRQLSIDTVAARHGVTPRYVSRLFESAATTFSEFVLTQRLNRAHRMLIAPAFFGRTVSSIAFEAGFGDISYFNRTFRRRYGETPSDVRAKAQRGEPN